MQFKAEAKYIKVSPQKARLVVDLIRGKKVYDAINVLKFTKKKSAYPVLKLLNSAIANASTTGRVDVDNLIVSKINVDMSLSLKRLMPKAMGRGATVKKRMSNIKIVLEEI
ncbi:MAG: 50S ribosomal protein L22 [Deltaproteobacteria bacterium]|jgi:large subunit ribosomal protein L22|uniref:Large ribosomal subunit protein uL22 n=1 Tax=Candidatus Acidulodesulfobacterium acidiphilum TaxID=2597224 RepID=A0A520XCV2_9DELT|nr:50S ribosomal protein L22 [Deltaproteobacteria bacterium]MCL6120079.1 50S ribosomal protein L22 [Deltaproteobacteria bacterium]MDA8299878.1 50S ribosomal protein L22 [Deltaproteobacteria bacterium]RZV38991.1 MAG: 50S ribosomal protein L22 [Candidatus Acidulodesulfobacterium acidiphilum]